MSLCVHRQGLMHRQECFFFRNGNLNYDSFSKKYFNVLQIVEFSIKCFVLSGRYVNKFTDPLGLNFAI